VKKLLGMNNGKNSNILIKLKIHAIRRKNKGNNSMQNGFIYENLDGRRRIKELVPSF
jgi:hypothetical protein